MNEFIESVKILSHQASPKNSNEWSVLKVHAPKIAQQALPGHFVSIQCKTSFVAPIMLVNKKSGTVDLLYHASDANNTDLMTKKAGDTLNLIAPLREAFEYHENRPRPLLICEDQGLAPIVFLASKLRLNKNCWPFVLMSSETTFPFRAMPSQFMIPGIPDGITATMPLLEDWNIPCRLTNSQSLPGCFDGDIVDLARLWIESLPTEQLNQIEIFSCTSLPTLESIVQLSEQHQLPCQPSLNHINTQQRHKP